MMRIFGQVEILLVCVSNRWECLVSNCVVASSTELFLLCALIDPFSLGRLARQFSQKFPALDDL